MSFNTTKATYTKFTYTRQMSVQMKICFSTSIINFATAIINLNLHLQQNIKILQRIWTAQEAYVNKITHTTIRVNLERKEQNTLRKYFQVHSMF